jgi:hypothetical protein
MIPQLFIIKEENKNLKEITFVGSLINTHRKNSSQLCAWTFIQKWPSAGSL